MGDFINHTRYCYSLVVVSFVVIFAVDILETKGKFRGQLFNVGWTACLK